jgi:glycosyltransferase involved in cell wall biosynthesis
MGTLGRYDDVERLIISLLNQTFKNFELIIVDQNTDNYIDTIINKYDKLINIKHIKILQKGLSLARNIGLKYASGNIVAFPDDDCEYPSNILEDIAKNFDFSNSNIISVKSVDKLYKVSSNGKWLNYNTNISFNNVFKIGISYTIFIKYKSLSHLHFDENLGIGTYLGSGEETDLILSLLHRKYNGSYKYKLFVYHKNKVLEVNRALSYGLGFGALVHKEIFIRKNYKFIKFFFVDILVKPFIKIILNLFKINKTGVLCNYYLYMGRIKGFFNSSKIYKK